MSHSDGKTRCCQRIFCTGFLYCRFTPETGRKAYSQYSAKADTGTDRTLRQKWGPIADGGAIGKLSVSF